MLYYPTTILVVDDDAAFLRGLQKLLSPFPFQIQTFNSPKKAIRYIREHQFQALDRIQSYMDDDGFDTGDVEAFIQDPSKINTISCVISDYSMASLSGIDFLQEVGRQSQKILFSGIFGYDQATDALNDARIDRFISKADPEFFAKFPQYVLRSTKSFFKEFLQEERDKLLLNFMMSFIGKDQYWEFYKLTDGGVFLLKDGKGQESFLYVFDKNSLATQAEEAQYMGKVPKKVISLLEGGEHGLCTYHQEIHGEIPPKDLALYTFPLKTSEDFPFKYHIEKNPRPLFSKA